MDPPPDSRTQEAELEELTGAHGQLREVATGDVDRDDSRRLLNQRREPAADGAERCAMG